MPFSQRLQELLQDYADQPLRLGTLLERSGEEGFGLLSATLSLPFLIFVPPGLSTIVALVVALLGWQMGMGRHQPWLPRRYAQLELPPALTQGLLKNLTRLLRPLERIMRPRWPRLSQHPVARRSLGFCIAWAALLMAIPVPPVIPLTNIFPSCTIVIIALAVMEGDGLLMVVGFGLTLATTVYFVAMAGLIVTVFQETLRLTTER
ncbi:MAG: exopolysaccharide biosynthesis protein [Synechococcales cyanobacterium]